ncbi:MAG: hypothetical protein NVSMB14_01660 [Isosphaeraceae bacterium]
MATKRPPALKNDGSSRKNRVISRGGRLESEIGRELQNFADSFKRAKFLEIVSAVDNSETGKEAGKTGKAVTIKVPPGALGQGGESERLAMQKLGWYWEPLLHDLQFYEEMRDSIAIIDGEIQKFVDTAMDGFKIVCDDPEMQGELEDSLIFNSDIDFTEAVRSAMVDTFSLGNAYKVPIWTHDDQGRLIPKTFRPVRANAMRKLRDADLAIEGYVQLLHRPSEFIYGALAPGQANGSPAIPTIYLKDEVACGQMRTFGWYAYGKPILASLPFVVRLKLTMERDLAEMLHQHVPRIDITFTPEEQMSQEQVDTALDEVGSDVSQLKTTDNWVHTPDTVFEYKGPQGKSLDFQSSQKHIENQFFYVLPFAQSIMGLDTQSNPYDSQQRWKIAAIAANQLRKRIEVMFAPVMKKIADDWGIDGRIGFGWSQLDPETQSQLAESDEYIINNEVLKRDNGFVDQDMAARNATRTQHGGAVQKAAADGKLPPVLDPNKPSGNPPSSGGNKPTPKPTGKVRRAGPKTDGTKAPAKDQRAKGRRHDSFAALDKAVDDALSDLR